MFGRGQAITAAEAVPGFQLDYRERLSDDLAVRWTDRLTLDGMWEGNLFQFYQRVMVRLGAEGDAGTIGNRPGHPLSPCVRRLLTQGRGLLT